MHKEISPPAIYFNRYPLLRGEVLAALAATTTVPCHAFQARPTPVSGTKQIAANGLRHRSPLLRSPRQTVKIGVISHSSGGLRLLKTHILESEGTLGIEATH